MLGHKVRDLPVAYNKYFNFKTNYPPNQIVGIEFEVEGSNLPTEQDLALFWKCHEDGSLRGESREYVLAGPNAFDYFKEKSLPYLLKQFNKKGSVIDMSSRCSTHVHISVHELYGFQVLMYAGLFAILEDLFYPLTGAQRDGNLFCLGCGNSEQIADTLLSCATSNSFAPIFKDEDNKYTSMNLRTLQNLGTVEFRNMEGTIEEGRINSWIDILLSIRNYVMKMSPKDCGNVLNMLSLSGPATVVKDILGGENSIGYQFIKTHYDKPTIHNAVYASMARIQSLFYEPEWDKINLIDKVEKPVAKKKTKIIQQIIEDEVQVQVHQVQVQWNVANAALQPGAVIPAGQWAVGDNEDDF